MGNEPTVYTGYDGWRGDAAYFTVGVLYFCFILAGALAMVGAMAISAILLGFDGIPAQIGLSGRRGGLPLWQRL